MQPGNAGPENFAPPAASAGCEKGMDPVGSIPSLDDVVSPGQARSKNESSLHLLHAIFGFLGGLYGILGFSFHALGLPLLIFDFAAVNDLVLLVGSNGHRRERCQCGSAEESAGNGKRDDRVTTRFLAQAPLLARPRRPRVGEGLE